MDETSKVFCNVRRHTSVAGGMEVPKKGATLFVAKQGGTADSKIIRPWQRTTSVRGFCLFGGRHYAINQTMAKGAIASIKKKHIFVFI